MTQQSETKDYFRSAAGDWQHKAGNHSVYSVIESRNQAVLDVMERHGEVRRFLDVGCGTGQLVLAVAQRGVEAEGIDFAEEMVKQCNDNAQTMGVGARFLLGSFFDTRFEQGAYDLISAQGFIEYISPTETDEFFRRCFAMLRPGGRVAIGSRNRLFNVCSLNDFTLLEAETGLLGTLAAEATIWHKNEDLQSAFQALRRFERIDPQPDRHPVTGIPVEVRYQYAPADLIYRLRLSGLETATLYPVHFHGLPLALKTNHLDLHYEIARKVSEIGLRDHRLLPYSSTFVIEARRNEETTPK